MVMHNKFFNGKSRNQIWEKIEIWWEGKIKVKDNHKQILISQYIAFMAKKNESITNVFEMVQ